MPATPTTRTKRTASAGGRTAATAKKRSGGTVQIGEPAVITPAQSRQIDRMLVRLERRGKELSASADKLLRRLP